MDDSPRLTSLAHGGGCGCKLSPAVLRELLARQPQSGPFPDLLVGSATADDAAVWRLNDTQALVATTDFFTPIVDDPRDFGRIAAANALSDIYAMGGRPIMALAIVGMPIGRLPLAVMEAIMSGGAEKCAEAGVPVAGGHSIDIAEPIYGLVALGIVDPARVMRNAAGRPGDVLILTKALGVGVLSAALKQDRLDADGYRAMVDSATKLNAMGADLPGIGGVHAVTDVTGFGLLGHALEMARGAGVTIEIDTGALKLLPGVETLVQAGVRTGASERNWQSAGDQVLAATNLPRWRRDLVTDPQTNGGLLIAVEPAGAPAVLALARDRGFEAAAIVGRVVAGLAGVTLMV